jgi:1-acyl-sn-glycerol-3-phosphate acyltransferase
MANPPPLWKLAQSFCRICTTCFFDLKVFGHRHVPHEGGVLLVANHQSYLDPVLLGARLSRPLNYIAKAELFENPRAARLLYWLNGYPVHQGTADLHAVRETIIRLRSGRALVIFPEGSRTPDGKMLPIERGVALVVRRAKVPVVPVVIDGSFEAWPIDQTLFRSGNIRLWFGPPMQLANLSEAEIVGIIGNTLREMLDTLRTTDIPPGCDGDGSPGRQPIDEPPGQRRPGRVDKVQDE